MLTWAFIGNVLQNYVFTGQCWLAGSLVILFVGYIASLIQKPSDLEDPGDILGPFFGLALFWPLLLLFGIIAGGAFLAKVVFFLFPRRLIHGPSKKSLPRDLNDSFSETYNDWRKTEAERNISQSSLQSFEEMPSRRAAIEHSKRKKLARN